MAVTQKDIAQRLGISQQAVASALSGKGRSRISEETRSRVLREAQILNYRPNLAARALTRQRSNLIAVWTRNLSSPFYAQLLHHIEIELRASGYEMIVRVVPEEDSLEQTSETTAKTSADWQNAQWPVDGVLAIELAQDVHRFLKSHPGAAPIVCVGGYDESVPELDYVWVDLYDGTYDAVRHLIDQGCKRVAALMHNQGFHLGSMRYEAYRTAMRDAGREPEYIMVPETTRLAARSTLQAYVEDNGCPDGIFCYNDDLALGAYRFLRESGMRIPDDVALVGCDGLEDTEYLERPLSTIISPNEEMCARAWKLLLRRMQDSEMPPQHEVLQAHLAIRDSSQRR